MYITIEGKESTGKSSVIEYLKENQNLLTKEVLFTKEPGSPLSALCPSIRSTLLNSESMSKRAALLLFLADRAQHMEEVVLPALDAGKIVISDRSSLSTLAYFFADECDKYEWSTSLNLHCLRDIMSFAQFNKKPDISFITTSDLDWSLNSMKERSSLDRIEKKGNDFHQKIHNYFLAFSEEIPNSYVKFFADSKFWPERIIRLPKIPLNSIKQVSMKIVRELAVIK